MWRFFFIYCIVLCSVESPVWGQKVQWASEIINFSSEYLAEGAIATQALGKANAMNEGGQQLAWGPRQPESITGDFIHVGFTEAMRIRQIAIAESLHPGAISRIIVYYTDGTKEKIYENKFPRSILAPNRLFTTQFDLTPKAVNQLRVELKTKAVKGRNMIDAIAISNSTDPVSLEASPKLAKKQASQAESLGKMINSTYSERMPLISPDGNTLYFARTDHPQNIGEENNDDIWVAFQQADGSWTQAVNVGAPLNNRLHNFVVAVAPSNDRIYLANEYQSSERNGISVAQKNGRSWSRPEALKIKDHYNNSPFVSYHVNLDENILLMAVDRDDSYGDMDIYVSFKEKEGTWSAPKNLGADINTVDVESSIFLAADNKTIYFASNGRGGLGGLDMFQSQRLDDSWTNWSKPQNLGQPINGPGNDYNYSIPASGDYAYFSSEDANGNADLFRISLPYHLLPDPVALLKAQVIDASTKQPIDAVLRVQNLEDATVDRELEAQQNGRYQAVLPVDKNLALVAEREGYFSVSEAMELTDQSLEEMDGDQEMLAQLEGPPSFNSAAAEQIRLRLTKLDSELRQLEKKKSSKSVKPNKAAARRAFRQSDPELDALRHKYTQAIRKESPQKKTDQLTSKGDTKVDEELEEMKRKFNLYNKKKEEDEEEYLDLEVGVGELSDGTEEDSEDYGFLDLQIKLWEQLEQELEEEVRLKLKKDLLNEVEKSVERKLKSEMNIATRSRLKQYVLDLNRSIKKRLREIKKRAPQSPSKSSMASFEKEMSRKLEPKVRRELRARWRLVTKQVLQAELEYLIKKEEEQRLRQELAAKQRKEIRAERKYKNRQMQEKSVQLSKPNQPLERGGDYQELRKDILLIPIKEGQILPMNNVFFDANKATLKSASTAELKRVLAFLKKNPQLVVEVGGHTNGWCSHVFANQLSLDRAKAVADYFIDQGIDIDRIRHQGYGKNQPLATNDTPQGRKKNQRVELKILEIKE
ncbi:MAG: OmpA family protein [Bacteroidota bacterium]